ncbi:hypothetical protein [uncultured Brevundimonas sp.]|uniref:hypothetical protein n=1 Tax=uncultured Brevundimonas sp. TaxID=213418 RepID=UPI0030EB8877
MRFATALTLALFLITSAGGVQATPRVDPNLLVTPPASEAPVLPAEITAEAAEQQARLDAAHRARLAAQRQIETEQRELATYGESLAAAGAALDAAAQRHALETEAALGLRQQALEARSDPAMADAVYGDLRAELRATRQRLGATLDAMQGQADLAPVPSASVDALAPGVERTAVRAQRGVLEARRAQLVIRLHDGNRTEARLLLARLTTLNEARLDLLPHLSAGKRRATTGFTPAGWNQVSAEFEHLVLIVRYHAHTLVEATRSGVIGRDILSASALLAASTLLWILVLAGFALWRATARRVLPLWEQGLQEKHRATLRSTPDPRLWGLRLFIAVRGPLEWLIMLSALRASLPAHVQNLLEVEIIGLVVGWTLIAAVASRLLDALLGAGNDRLGRRARELGPLRLRSMRLVSNVVVGFILVLTLTAKLVGEGAFHNWVASTGWLAALLTVLILIIWWRGEVFEQLDRHRRPNALQRWVLANRTGRTAAVAAVLGTADVVIRSVSRTIRTVGSRFISVRRTLAFLFRQELSRADRNTVSDLVPLPEDAFANLSPEVHGETWVATRLEPMLDLLAQRSGGGLVVLVGERGSGKTAALRQLQQRMDGARLVKADELDPAAAGRRSPSRARAQTVVPAVMLVDDLEALVRFDVGGLSALDTCLDLARETADRTLWVLAIDSAVWDLVCRLRSVSTVFNTVIEVPHWTDMAIAELLQARVAEAGITPGYDRMIEDLTDLDDIDRREAVEAKNAAFMLLLWDASDGNPGVALHLWRSVLGVAADGTVFVRPLDPVIEAAIERLPLEALFIYRAVLRQAGARPAEIVAATRLPAATVADVLRSGVQTGHLLIRDGGHHVSWDWYRALTRSLVRRHLGSIA